MKRLWIFVFACTLLSSLAIPAALGNNVIVGANVVAVDQASEQDRDALIEQLQRYGVKTIRMSLGGHGDRYTTFAVKAYQHGINAVIFVDPCDGNTKQHALPPDASAGRPWGLSALSDADPDGFRKVFSTQLATLEAAGVKVTAFELGNELNTPRFNADFRPEQISGRVLGLSDLNNPADREAHTVATGYRAYIKIMAVLKDLRDHSKLNQKTPILSGMSADWGKPQDRKPGEHRWPDAVGIADSIEFLRQNGLDRLVDGYGVHTYPSDDPHLTVSARIALLESRGVLSACRQGTKPCWMTEWGFNNASQSCPINDKARTQVIEAERSAFKQFAEQGRLAAILFYSWSGVLPFSWDHSPNRKADVGAIYRCGVLTDAGKLAVKPL
jgi:hypothetical protein